MPATPVLAQELRTYYITCDSAEFAYIILHPEDIIYIDCTFEYDGEIWPDARLRLRGESSLYYPKKSYKINFDDDNPFYDRDKINLISEWTDPSYSREHLSYDLYQRAGLYASQTWFAGFYVNGDYLGLYLDVEQVDEHFLERSGLPEGASIYKADGYGCVLSTTEPVEELWEKKTNEATGFYDLHNLIEWLDATPNDEFFEDLGQFFLPEELARVIAVNALIANQSTYYHNYYLIHELNQGGYWRMIPWDMDLTYKYWSNYENPQYFRSGHQLLSTLNILIQRCWMDTTMRALIFQQMDGLMDSLFVQDYYESVTDTLAALLYDAVVEDTLKQFTVEEFLTSLEDIPIDVAGRAASITDRRTHDPLPFDFHPALITPTGVYFSWDSTSVADGSQISYEIWLGDDRIFSGDVTVLDCLTGTSLLYGDLEPGTYYWRVYAVSESGGRTRSLTFFSTIEIAEGAFSGTTVTGTIQSSTTWDVAGSPYSLPEGLGIAPGAILTIEPGVLVGIGTQKSITIEGGLIAIGTADDSIHFVPMNPDSNWQSIIIENPSDEVNLSFASIIGGSSDEQGPVPVPGGMIQISGGQLHVYDSHLGWGQSGLVASNNALVHLERASMDHFCSTDLLFIYYGSIILRSSRFAPGWQGNNISDIVDINWVSENSEISRCELYGCNDDAIDLDGVHNLEISRNFITGAAQKGINIGEGSGDISVSNNTVTACSIGVGLKHNSNAVLYNNNFLLNKIGLTINEGESLEAIVRNTVFWLDSASILSSPEANLTVEYCVVEGAEPYPGQGNINGDPCFVDVWNGNYYPMDVSPLIDAGYGTGHPEFDLVDSARYDVAEIPNTGAGDVPYVDIGIYEFYPYEPPSVQPTRPPDSYIILENYPNPFNTFTRINFSIIEGDWAELSIYNILGRRVFRRRFDRQIPGPLSIIWNGRDESGALLSSGIYICLLRQELALKTEKMVMIK